MSVNLSIKDVPDDLADRLRERAARHHRSLQGELMAIVEAAASEAAPPAARSAGASRHASSAGAEEGIHPLTGRRYRVQGWKTVEQLMAEREAAGWKPDPSLAKAPLGVDITRADRDAR